MMEPVCGEYSDEDAYYQPEAGPDPQDLWELEQLINHSVIHEDDFEGGRWHPGD